MCSVTGLFGQLHDGKLYRELFKGVFKALGRVGVGKGALELKAIQVPHEVCELWSGAQGFDVSF